MKSHFSSLGGKVLDSIVMSFVGGISQAAAAKMAITHKKM
jgi:hypothetical protein